MRLYLRWTLRGRRGEPRHEFRAQRTVHAE